MITNYVIIFYLTQSSEGGIRTHDQLVTFILKLL